MAKITCRRAQPGDWQDIKEITRLAFDEVAKHPIALEELQDETWFSIDHWLVAEADGRVVASMGLRPGVMWMQGMAMPTATVGVVGTRPDLRGRGVGMALMRFAGDVVKEEELVLSRLHTSAPRYAFYQRVGYVKAINSECAGSFEIDAISPETRRRAEEDLGDGVIRPAHARDAMRLNDIYEATFSKVTGCLSRNEHFFLRRIARHPKFWLWSLPTIDVLETPRDGVVAYASYALGEKWRDVKEIATLPEFTQMARPLMLHVAREVQRAGGLKVNCPIDPFEPLGWLVREFRVDVDPDEGVLFLKVHDAPRFLELTRGVIERTCARHEVELTLSVAGIGDVVIGSGQRVRIVTDVNHLAALVYNGTWLAGLLAEGAVFIHPETVAAHHLVQMVFPDTHAHRCHMDGY